MVVVVVVVFVVVVCVVVVAVIVFIVVLDVNVVVNVNVLLDHSIGTTILTAGGGLGGVVMVAVCKVIIVSNPTQLS